MALSVFNQGHTHRMEIERMVHVTATIAVIEVKVNHQDASVMVIVLAHVASHCHVGAVDYQIT